MSQRYKKSELLLERALKVIPGGTQTFSKSLTQYPRGVSPYYVERGEGCRVWDVDGNEYLDFVSGLLAVNLGYSDLDVDTAVKDQLGRGVTLSLPMPIEIDLTEHLVDMIPCAEMVRFGKNGSDATSAAIRVARAYTGREPVVTTLRERGEQLTAGLADLIERHGVGEFISQSGFPVWTFINFNDLNGVVMWKTKSLWMQECQERGVLCLGTHNLNYAHGEADINYLLDVYDQVFPILKDAVHGGNIESHLRCDPLEPLFKVR